MSKVGEEVRTMIWRNRLSQTWLIRQLEMAGVRTDDTRLSGYINGRRRGPAAEHTLDASKRILLHYEEQMGVGKEAAQS